MLAIRKIINELQDSSENWPIIKNETDIKVLWNLMTLQISLISRS